MLPHNFKILISRTDSIGDVVLTLPVAGVIKKHYPEAKILFLGRTYTREIINLSQHVDGFVNYDDLEKLNTAQRAEYLKASGCDIILHVFPRKEIAFLAKRAGIPLRVGTRNRAYHWFTCNKLLKLSRKKSSLHEAQLNIKLLEFLGIDTNISLSEVSSYYGF